MSRTNGRRNRFVRTTNPAVIPLAASCPAPAKVPTIAEHQSVATVLRPVTLIPSRRITPAPRKPTPETTWAAIRVGLLSLETIVEKTTKPAAPTATRELVRNPAMPAAIAARNRSGCRAARPPRGGRQFPAPPCFGSMSKSARSCLTWRACPRTDGLRGRLAQRLGLAAAGARRDQLGGAGLGAVAAEIGDDAIGAVGLARLAHVAAMQDQPMMRIALVFGRRDRLEPGLDRERRLARGDPGAVGHPEDVRVDGDRRFAERDLQHDV